MSQGGGGYRASVSGCAERTGAAPLSLERSFACERPKDAALARKSSGVVVWRQLDPLDERRHV